MYGVHCQQKLATPHTRDRHQLCKNEKQKIEDVTLEDLKDFYSRNKIESASIEYKRILNISNREEIKELLADISSFANSRGAYMIFGIDEENGIVGFKSESIDKTNWYSFIKL